MNVAIYVLWNTVGPKQPELLASHLILSKEAVLSGRVWTLITSCFSHIDPMHLLFNCLALYVFGQPVARVIGERQLLALYLAGGLAASLGWVAWSAWSGIGAGALGASGSVMAVAVLFAMLFPKRTLLLNFFVPVPAWLAVLFFILADLAGLLGGMGGLERAVYWSDVAVAHAAHLGGAAVGFMRGLMVLRSRRRRPA